MATKADRFLNQLAGDYSPERMIIPAYGFVTLLVIVIGVVGLFKTVWPRQLLESWINIHILFGLLLCGLVLSRCQWRLKQAPHLLPGETRELSRHLSRIVYLVLFVVIGARQSIGILGSLWHGGAVDFNLFDERFRNGPDTRAFDPKDDFQQFVASGLVALGVVRVVAFRLWLRAVERATLSASTTGVDIGRAAK
jgi:cytochrome b561